MIFFFSLENGILCVLIRIASLRRFEREHTTYLHVQEYRKDISVYPPDLELLLTLIGSNYPFLELIFMVPKVFEPLKFDCSICMFYGCVVRIEKFVTRPVFDKDFILMGSKLGVTKVVSLCENG